MLPRPVLPRALGVVALLVAGLASGACFERDEPAAARPRNLLLVTVDTLRADHLGCYGYSRDTSPALDALARRSILFERAKASSSWTLPTIASLLTSTYPPTHRCRNNDSALTDGLETLAEALSEAGFLTGAIVNHIFLDARYGLDQGFEQYDQELVQETAAASHRAVTSPRVTEKARAWLSARASERDGRRWLLWVHYFDPHSAYVFHEGVTERFASSGADGPTYTDVDLYDGEIAFTDRSIGELLEALEELGLAEETAVAFVADHGEAFGEHDSHGHRETLYRETLRVPMLLHVNGLPAARFEPPVSTLDLMPTLLSVLGVGAPPLTQGQDLLPALLGSSEHRPRPILAELAHTARPLTSLQRDRWKLIRDEDSGAYELYDLETDPRELTDLAGERTDVVERLRWLLVQQLDAARILARDLGEAPDVRLDGEDRQRLEALGYTGDD